MLPVEQPFKTYTGLDGKPLDNGYVYFGQPNQDPIAHPVTVYWDAAGTQPAPQELRTVNGYIMNAGTPANVFFDGAYSELVKDSKGRQVFYARTSDEFSIATTVSTFLTKIAAAVGSTLIGFIQAGVGAVKRTAQDKLRDFVSAKDFGAVGDGVADDTAALQAAITACITFKKELFIPAGTYNVSKTLGFGSQYCLKINGPIKIRGEGQFATIIRTVKVGGALPDGSGAGYAGAIGIVTSMATPEIGISQLTLEGGNTSTGRAFNMYHKAIFCDLNAFLVAQYHLEFVTIQNFEGEGAYAPNGNISNAVFFSCHFENCGGSMGNTAGSTKYLNCRFIRGNNCGIEMALDPYVGSLTVDNCHFFNASQNAGASIACQGPSFDDASKRTGSKLIVRNSTFEYTQAWLTSTNAGPNYRVSPLSFIGIGTVVVQNNVFTNATTGIPSGHGIMLIRDFNDTIDFSNNVIKVNDALFNTTISHGNMGTTRGLQVRDNTTLSEYPLNVTQDLYQSGGSITGERFTTRGNTIQMKTGIAFTPALTIVDNITLPPYKAYTLKMTFTVVNAVASVVDFVLGGTQIALLINEVLPAGHYTRYATVTLPATAAYNNPQTYRIRCSGDAANSFSVSLTEA